MAEPLFLQSVMQEKIWGGTKLRDEFGYESPSDRVGEYWAISAHPNGVSIIKNGRYAGYRLDDLYREHRELFANRTEEVFPLLTKMLDANDWLSVQVHPDDAYGLAHEGELGKTECWYVLAADEGSEIIYGHKAQSRDELRKKIEQKDWENLLQRIPVKAGDFFYVPSGTIHAIGKGIMILETQQSSDTTYRVYDFDRRDDAGNLRELHLDKSIDVTRIGKPANSRPVTLQVDNLSSTLLVANDFFSVYKWAVTGEVFMKQTADYYLVSVLAGAGELVIGGSSYAIGKGDHFILPHDVKDWTLKGQALDIIASHP
ncbi:mannose-6-phosphate isomerase, class I [Streptococcus azizii]|uniref:Mannose-6-phosphate isomerase n=1 Tax=Streptococcus azizii TaxID=1579424 RepID=A0AB36JSU6_9STRE|nr:MULTISPECIES: mannose-6-phosphate isomerase, class I [Streptococcus]MBF0776250.1 mannose-6-phosphate isomerase, class I [Streptococcus sp. 19428wD3_AN2]ONK28108.1 mannose-6-phosphate isomerase, class I [Streptococcus azizii]ONK30506.1 mannose-6-phosphate isomerase, class I [Streptococcus azizii]ONK31015.1 mannose-6-phosphate isomerase, class I [Streptococcus azizii]TFU83380.1 mannose-6-phosphate isomerase, class I [Streptococcus sp. AN2]